MRRNCEHSSVAKTIVILLFSCAAWASPEEDAAKQAALAAYKQFGLEAFMNKTVETRVPKQYKKVAEKIAPIISIVTEKRVLFTWNF